MSRRHSGNIDSKPTDKPVGEVAGDG